MVLSKSTRYPVDVDSFPLFLQELNESDKGNYTCVLEALLRNTLKYNVTDHILIEVNGNSIFNCMSLFFFPGCLFLSCLLEICVIFVLIASVFSLFSFVFIFVAVAVVVVAFVVVLDVLVEEEEEEEEDEMRCQNLKSHNIS